MTNKLHTTKIIISMTILIALIIATSLLGASVLKNTSNKLESHISKIEDNTTHENWDDAIKGLDDIEKDWTSSEVIWSMLIDHIEIDNIDNSLTRMKKYIEVKDKALALGELANLKQYVKHIPQKETFNLRNVF